MKSFLYEIPAEYFKPYKFSTVFRIKVMYERDKMEEFRISPDMVSMISITSWTHIYNDCETEVERLWKESLASVDITPGDGCEHSDQMIPE